MLYFISNFETFSLIGAKTFQYSKLLAIRLASIEIDYIYLGAAHIVGGVKFDPSGTVPISGHEEPIATIRQAIKYGINYIDIAPFYAAGRAEILMGMVNIMKKNSKFHIQLK